MENRKWKNRNTIRKLSSFFIICLLVFIGVATNTNIARADPHGIYYTAIGQQQLFFNVLAALDQADYVETALAREEKREAREAIDAEQPFIRESESGARFTKETELEQDESVNSGEPDLVNRQVTLEGADLYTDQLVRQFGAESARRNAAAELLQALCENGFGFEGCDYDTAGKTLLEKQEIETRRRNAAIVNPLAEAGLPFTNGVLAALNSGNSAANIVNPDPNGPPLTDDEYRAGKILNPDLFGSAPLAYSKDIDSWRKFIDNETDYPSIHTKKLNKILAKVSNDFASNKKAIYPYQERKYNGSDSSFDLVGLTICGTSLCMNPNPPSWSIANNPNTNTVTSYLAAVGDMAITEREINDIAARAAQRVATQQEAIQSEGILAKTTLNENPEDAPLSQHGELTINIDTPVAARKASIYGIPNILGMLATSQQTSSLEGLDIPGSVQLVKRPAGYTPGGPVALLPNASGSQVAGALDLLFNDTDPPGTDFDKTKRETSPSANIISPILEFGARHALRVLTAGKWRESTAAGITCGFTCD